MTASLSPQGRSIVSWCFASAEETEERGDIGREEFGFLLGRVTSALIRNSRVEELRCRRSWFKWLVGAGLLTREDTRPGQRARYSLTEPRSNSYSFAQLGSWDFATGPPAACCVFVPSCSNKADPRSGRSSWTNCAHQHLS